MLRHIRSLWKPEIYHGPGSHAVFFEGWYYRLVARSKRYSLIIIPGIYINTKEKLEYAFIQIMDSESYKVSFHRFESDDMHISRDSFSMYLGNNYFSADSVELDIQSVERTISGRVFLKEKLPWPIRPFSPGAMGWYAFMPFMQCYHGVLSFDHAIDGSFHIDGKKKQFDGGRGYLEKDWGHTFPRGYVWLQSNQFAEAGCSIFATVANIPWLRGSFRGFLAGFLHDGIIYRFTTYNGSRVERITADDSLLSLTLSNRKHTLSIEAEQKKGALLYGPDGNTFVRNVHETLDSCIRVKLMKNNKENSLIFEGTGSPAALEIHGVLEDIID